MSGRSQGSGDKKKREVEERKQRDGRWQNIGWNLNSGQESRVLASTSRGASAIFTACNVKTNVWATSTGTSKQEKYCVSGNCRCCVTAAYASFYFTEGLGQWRILVKTIYHTLTKHKGAVMINSS